MSDKLEITGYFEDERFDGSPLNYFRISLSEKHNVCEIIINDEMYDFDLDSFIDLTQNKIYISKYDFKDDIVKKLTDIIDEHS